MVGEIRDEFRQNDNDWLRQPDGTLVGQASLPIFSLERILGIDIENEELGLEDVASVGGLIMVKLGDIPKQGQRITFADFDIVVKKMNGPRIVLVKVIPKLERDPTPTSAMSTSRYGFPGGAAVRLHDKSMLAWPIADSKIQ